jgi:hypothetical protein
MRAGWIRDLRVNLCDAPLSGKRPQLAPTLGSGVGRVTAGLYGFERHPFRQSHNLVPDLSSIVVVSYRFVPVLGPLRPFVTNPYLFYTADKSIYPFVKQIIWVSR